jgi:hypothetical protein
MNIYADMTMYGAIIYSCSEKWDVPVHASRVAAVMWGLSDVLATSMFFSMASSYWRENGQGGHLLELMARLQVVLFTSRCEQGDGLTVLQYLCLKGHTTAVDVILAAGADVNARHHVMRIRMHGCTGHNERSTGNHVSIHMSFIILPVCGRVCIHVYMHACRAGLLAMGVRAA